MKIEIMKDFYYHRLVYYALVVSALGGSTVGISGNSSLTPGSQSKTGQQTGKAAVLLVLVSLSLHLGLGLGRGPQSSTSSRSLPSSSALTQVDLPQKGVSSQLWPGSMVAHFVEAKHIPGKSDQFTTNKIVYL